MFSELAYLSIHNLLRARSRLLMTAGGVMIGTTAVVLLIALTIGLQAAAEAGIGEDSSLTQITIYAGFRRDSTSPTLNLDAVAELEALDDVAAVIPLFSLSGFAELRSGDLRGAAQVYGIYPDDLADLGVEAAQGDLLLDALNPYGAVVGGSVSSNFVDEDADTFASVTVDLMATDPDLTVYGFQGSLRKVSMEITGILETGSNFDSYIFFPMDTVIRLNDRVTGEDTDPEDVEFDTIIVQASGRETAAAVLEAITDLGYNATGSGSYLEQLNGFFGTLRLVLGGVGGVAMLVAAFGVANTMTMAILERTQEIGLMKAVGATDRDVLTIFLIEAGLVGLLGGAAGLGISYLLQNLANRLLGDLSASGGLSFFSMDISGANGNFVSIPPELALFAVGMATVIGVIAGAYPAWRAARIVPVIALKSD